MKKSSLIRLTVVAAVGLGAQAADRPEPCASANFDEHACQTAVQQGGYCWNGRWVRMKYHYPYPYYYDSYVDYLATLGPLNQVTFGACTSTAGHSFFGAHGGTRAGFGSTGACHSAHG